jgi:hypothetical protein
MEFKASGTGDHDTAFMELMVYEDSGNMAWDGVPSDFPAVTAPASGFIGSAVTFNLLNTTITAGTMRRFFLVGKLGGSATTGQTFNANLQGITAVPPLNGAVVGIPTAPSVALIIDVPAVTVSNGPSQPTSITHKAGVPGAYVIAQHRIGALNGPALINSVTLTTGGSGDWWNDVDSAAGVEVYRDDGDGAFNSSSDTILFQGAGGPSVNASFSPALSLSTGTVADLWVRVGLTANAGGGALSAPDTFTIQIASPFDVQASTVVLFGNPAPGGVVVGAIEFSVTTFSPIGGQPNGGEPIVIEGTGLVSPVIVKIGGQVCPGTASVSGGTKVTGLRVPTGGGSLLPIEVASGTLPSQTLPQTFSYSKVGSPDGSDGSGCSTRGANGWMALIAMLAGMLAGLYVRGLSASAIAATSAPAIRS